MAAGVVFFFK